jgi:hypothetical protein
MTITIKLNTGNAAFAECDDDGTREQQRDARDREVGRILRAWAARIPEDGYSANLYDANGNRVGTVTMRGK